MNKSQLVAQIALQSGVSKVDVQKSINALIKITADTLAAGEKISVSGLGAFTISRHKERMGRNFRTGERVKIAAKNSVKFSAASELNALVQ